jgi:hypothetical protein
MTAAKLAGDMHHLRQVDASMDAAGVEQRLVRHHEPARAALRFRDRSDPVGVEIGEFLAYRDRSASRSTMKIVWAYALSMSREHNSTAEIVAIMSSAITRESEDAEYGERDGSREADGPHRQFVGDPVADEHGRNVGQHHA